MSDEQDSGSSAEDTTSASTAPPEPTTAEQPTAEPEPKSKKKSKPEKAPDSFLVCSNHCGFNTRWPKAQALIAKGDKIAKEPYLCPMCDANGMSSKLVTFG